MSKVCYVISCFSKGEYTILKYSQSFIQRNKNMHYIEVRMKRIKGMREPRTSSGLNLIPLIFSSLLLYHGEYNIIHYIVKYSFRMV